MSSIANTENVQKLAHDLDNAVATSEYAYKALSKGDGDTAYLRELLEKSIQTVKCLSKQIRDLVGMPSKRKKKLKAE
jgi:hypothetical protein